MTPRDPQPGASRLSATLVGLALAVVVGAVGLLGSILGCSGGEPLPDGPELKAYAEKACEEAKAAEASGDPKAARVAADRAEAACTKAERQLQAAAPEFRDQAQQLAGAIRAAASEAERFARLAAEAKEHRDKVGSWSARGYHTVRGAALTLLAKAMGVAAEQAGAKGYGALSPKQRDLADGALRLAGDPRLPDGQPDWQAVAARLSTLAADPPAELALVLAAAMYVLDWNDIALYEIESISPEALKVRDWQIGCQALRGLIYGAHGWNHLGGREFEALAPLLADPERSPTGPQLAGLAHVVAGAFAMSDGDVKRADLELMRAVKADPASPMAALLTGEIQVAEGKYEKAEGTFEQLAADIGSEDGPWLAEMVQKRVRQIRDRQGDAVPFFYSAGFVRDLAIAGLQQAARTSEAGKRLQAFVDSARATGQTWLEGLPEWLRGKGEPPQAEPAPGQEP